MGNTEETEKPVTEHLLWATPRARNCTWDSLKLLQAPLGTQPSSPIPVKRESGAQECEVALVGAWEAKMEAISDCRSWARMN